MSTLRVNEIKSSDTSQPIALNELGYRVIKNYRQNYTGGQWNPDTNYNWVPGMFFDYTPASASSRIRVYCNISYVGLNAAHGISHWIFYANGVERGRHSISGNHLEDNACYTWDFPSWGITAGRIGYQMRSYANDNNEVRPYTTRYWDGTGSQQNCIGQFIIEEYIQYDELVLNLDAGDRLSYPGGGTTWMDLSNYKNNGTLINGVGYISANNGALVFDGVNDYVDCGNPTSLRNIGGTSNITVSAWVYYTAYGGGGQPYSVLTVKGDPWTWLMENPSNTFRFRITAGGADVSVADTATHLLNRWYNVVGTYDGANMRIYVDGVLKNTRAQTGTLATNSVTAKIGTYQGTNYNVTGRIAKIQVYNRTLSLDDIQRSFNGSRSRFGI
jgi:hypothetical protein